MLTVGAVAVTVGVVYGLPVFLKWFADIRETMGRMEICGCASDWAHDPDCRLY